MRVLGSIALFVALLCGTCYVAMPYRTAAFMLDDVIWMVEIGLLTLDDCEFNWPTYLLIADGVHAYPLWKSVYYLIWRLCGPQSEYWRYVIWTMHALSAWLAYFFVRRATGTVPAGLLGAALWATHAAGGWDSPLLWTGCGFYPIALVAFLGAMLALQQNLAKEVAGPWPWLMAIMAFLAVATWTPAAAWLPILGCQGFLFATPNSRPLHKQRWLQVWFAMCALLLPVLAVRHLIVAPAGASEDSQSLFLVLPKALSVIAYSTGKALSRN
jgi:hypothetical protein